MNTLVLFLLGLMVMVMVILAVILVGLSEAAELEEAHPEEVADWERKMLGEAGATGEAPGGSPPA